MNTTLPLTFDNHTTDIFTAIFDNQAVVGTTAALGAALIWYLVTTDNSEIKKIRGWPLVGQWAFFTRRVFRTTARHDFVLEGFHKLPAEPMFGFNILKHNVVAMRGEEARKAFFDNRELSFTQGYRLLLGGNPDVKDVAENVVDKNDQEQMSWFVRRLAPLLKMERLGALTPLIMADIERNMLKWGKQGKFDPFEDIYSIVFQLTIRTTACREIADSVQKCKDLERLYWQVEKGSTPTSILLPWLPSEARKRKVAATTEIFNIFDDIIKARQKEGRSEEDALQALMELGDSTVDVIQFVLGTLFAGIVNTGLMSAWIFIFLDQEPEWRDKVIDELRTMLNKHAPLSKGYATATERFSDIPSDAWENEMPVLEACLKETMRIILCGAALRRLIKGNLDVAGKTIPNGSFLVHLAGETHHNPEIYPEPHKFNPGRFTEGQDKSQAHAFLGWGAGRHPCLGRRFAQYEIKAICAMFLTSYHYEVLNSKGQRPDPSTTVPDKNNLYQARPKDEVFYIKYTKRESQL